MPVYESQRFGDFIKRGVGPSLARHNTIMACTINATFGPAISKRLILRLRLFLILVSLMTLAGSVNAYFSVDFFEPDRVTRVWHSGLTWLVGGALVWGMEILWLPSRYGVSIRRLNFLSAIAVKSGLTLLIAILVSLAEQIALHQLYNPLHIFQPPFLDNLSIAFVAIILLQSTLQIIRIVGAGTLVNFILGRYVHPVREEKIFMFLDLVGSTALAEKLGDVRFQSLLTRFFFDINEPILEHGGEIYRYVGDEVIVTWPIKSREDNAEAIRCCFALADFVNEKAAEYRDRFGVVPAFRIGLHGGPVLISQMGDQKQEISYFGDTVNTTARIEQQCKVLDCQLLVSGELIDEVLLPRSYHLRKMGSVQLRGRERTTDLYSVSKNE